MKFEIKHWYSGAVLFSLECGSLRLCVEAAVKSGADLYGADLSGANLSRANLSGANLSRANLSRADLSRADLSGADLSRANLSGADLSRADLSRADLSRANLSGAYLSGANLYGANLYGADLSRANLSGADLSRANLYGANLYGAKELSSVWIARNRITPEEGAFVGWKKLQNQVIARLVIPHDAKRVNALGSRKCRAERVFVHAMWDGKKELPEGYRVSGLYDLTTIYTVGKETVPDSYDDSIQVECSHGIHFYMTRAEAEEHG